jgi:hypothetical protein
VSLVALPNLLPNVSMALIESNHSQFIELLNVFLNSGSQKSFDYDEVVEEFEDLYADRDKMKKRSAKAELTAAKKRLGEED